ncbi:SMP-30/Gluconolaconase/LRE-like region-domain-containing protein [Xylariomycetidae sp. FL0641]|nr:SMP-30/Gluconolaconase/LRE-like region-domain-containing protein [Xylariomycetidae sp. FL0641]
MPPTTATTQQGLEQWDVREPYLNLHCGLGEGPYYEAATHSVRFVDIVKQRVHSVQLDAGPASVTTTQLDAPVTVTADIAGVDPREKILIGAKYGLAILDRRAGTYEYTARFAAPDQERLRSNDGAVDPHGRFWLGTMSDIGLDLQPEGHLYLFDGAPTARSMRHPVTIPNSVGWSPDNKTMYFTHSTERTVYAWDYGAEDGKLSNERVFYRHDGPGEPDGFRIDTDGNMWHAVYGESRVLKISPEGRLVGQVNLPTHNITCTQFVGTELFITTAGMKDGEGSAEAVELSGALFRVDVGARGLEPFPFRMAK